MAQVIVEMFPAGVSHAGPAMPVVSGKDGSVEEVTTSGTSAATTITAGKGFFASIYNADASQLVWAQVGSSPTAAVDSGFTVGPLERRDIGPLANGDKIALINDS